MRVVRQSAKESLLHFAGRHAMNIDGLEKKLSISLVDKGLVKDVADFYELKLEDVAALDRMAEKSAQTCSMKSRPARITASRG